MIKATSIQFRYYRSGVITSPDCGTDNASLSVTAVGYGTDENGTDYYVVRNSWGTGWGDDGYAKIGRSGDGPGICGIQTNAVWPKTN